MFKNHLMVPIVMNNKADDVMQGPQHSIPVSKEYRLFSLFTSAAISLVLSVFESPIFSACKLLKDLRSR